MSTMVSSATRAELAEVVALLHTQLVEHAISTQGDVLERAVAGMLERPDRGVILVARDGGAVVGVAWVSFTWSCEHGGQTAWLEELYVVPALRGRGLGRAMLLEAEARARAAGCAAVDLEVDAEHTRAARLYQREGFSPLPRARWVKPLR
jgi:GNAT superfamily N-acetyltransferase